MYQKPDFLYNKNNKDSTFTSEIERDSNICNSCYRKIREHIETKQDIASPITEYEEHVDFGYFDDFKETGRPNSHESYCVCGSVDWQDARLRPVESVEDMVTMAKRISNRLDEKGIKHTPSRLVSYVEENAQLPPYQDREEKVFEEAVVCSLESIETESADEEILERIE
jgi:hypothetical protein